MVIGTSSFEAPRAIETINPEPQILQVLVDRQLDSLLPIHLK